MNFILGIWTTLNFGFIFLSSNLSSSTDKKILGKEKLGLGESTYERGRENSREPRIYLLIIKPSFVQNSMVNNIQRCVHLDFPLSQYKVTIY